MSLPLGLKVLERAWLGLVLFVGCAPDFRFAGQLPAHCSNARQDSSETGVDCGGADCSRCGIRDTCLRSDDCDDASCIRSVCQAVTCSNRTIDNGETDLDCGGQRCAGCADLAHCSVGADCQSKVCRSGECTPPSCDDQTRNGDELGVDCGGSCSIGCPSGTRCTRPQDCASGDCEAGVCRPTCVGGKAECDGNPSTECETNLKTDPLHCGRCDVSCVFEHGEASCVGGQCVLSGCKAPYEDCDVDATTGCETNLSKDPDNCSACDRSCSSLNGARSCNAGVCGTSCEPGFADCDKKTPGCETATNSDVGHCGDCDTICTAPEGATPYCVAGKCGYSTCPTRRGDCNGRSGDECESDLLSDARNCGACGNVCAAEHGTASCENGTCVVHGCEQGYGNCDGDASDGGYADGCETNLLTSSTSCGKCGERCDIAHANSQCDAGVCKVKTCVAPFQDCDGDGLDCEVDTSKDKDNCGGCGKNGIVCDALFPNASGICVDGACAIGQCAPNLGACDTSTANGCETDLRSDIAHCGGCTTACKTANASSTSCSVGICRPQCRPGWGACTDPIAGCVDPLDTAAHCGSCTTSCSGATGFCINGGCAPKLSIALINAAVTGASTYDVNKPDESSRLTFPYTLSSAPGKYRLLLLALASGASTAAHAQPTSVRFGDTAMHGFGTPLTYGTPPAFTSYYYLVDSELPAVGTTQNVVIDASGTGEVVRLIGNLLEFTGVEQYQPLEAPSQNTNSTCVLATPKAIAVLTSGSYIYDLAAGEWCPSSNPVGGLTKTLDLTVNYGNLCGFGGYRGPVDAGSYQLSWSTAQCNSSAHFIVAIRPATTP